MNRALVFGLMLMAGALSGCATSLETNTPSTDRLASPTMMSPTPPAGNVFLPSPGPHYHGSMGP